ncbi:MAG: membrane-bound lytic murein transglycosylase D [Cyclobacteriaceae bacterium]|jgi:membrane-bound lytic murein transglycosylase D
MIRIVACLFFTLTFYSALIAEEVDIPKVPSEMEFAGLHLKITEGARRDIQKDVDVLRRSSKYYNIKLERVRLYFPLIEEALREEKVPEDFKYLCLQESGLISDQVSSSNAVGFWQFKDFTGKEVGLRIDRNIDERLNIVASTHGAARYFKRHNFYFRNWLYTVLAHMTGMTGAKKYVDPKKYGASKMTVDTNTHWYIKRFLAHKIAFEKEENGNHSEGWQLVEYKKGQGKTISQIADNHDIDEELLTMYNKWLKRGKIPDEKEYSVIIPVINKMPKTLAKETKQPSIKPVGSKPATQLGKELNRNKTIFIKINRIPGILAKSSETGASMAAEGGIALSKFLKYNDLKNTDAILEGEVYYLKAKKRKANVFYHTTEPGESLWDISQKFGVKLKRLAKMNRMSIIDDPETGRLMWLRKTRPKDMPVEIKELPTRAQIEEIIGKPYEEKKKAKIEMPNPNLPVETTEVEIKAFEKQESVELFDKKNYRIHKIEKGETLYSISKKYNVQVIDLMDINDTNGAISIGQELYIPESEVEVIKEFEEEEVKTSEKQESVELIDKKNYRIHKIEKGETLYSISKKYNVQVIDLMDINDTNRAISIGQELYIPEREAEVIKEFEEEDKEVEKSDISLHVVGPGDTIYKISKMYNISVEKLLELNQKDNFDLAIGEKLVVKEEK